MFPWPTRDVVVWSAICIFLATRSTLAEDLTLSAAKAFRLESGLALTNSTRAPAFPCERGGGAADPAGMSIGPRAGRPSVKAAMGFTLEPGTFLLSLGADYFFTDRFNLGPLLQLGISDDRIILAPTLSFQWLFDLPPDMERWKPFLQWGLGLAYLEKDNRSGRNDDTGFLVNFGFGFEYYLTGQISLGNNLLFNFMPDRVLDEHFFFSWQFVTARFTF